jgi:hypothetical protein
MNLTLAVMLAALAAGTPDDDEAAREAERAQQDREEALRTWTHSHAEVTFGYLAQWADERSRALELTSSSGDAAIAGLVTEPFLGAPYNGAVLAGPALEVRSVVEQVRLTVGVRFPFTSFRPGDTAHTVTLAGAPHDVLVRSVSLWDLRTGIGFELPFRRVTPFVDVLGDVQTMSTQLTIDGSAATYTGRAFSLGGRIGARYQVSHLFLLVAVEATALGPVRYGGTMQMGFGF